MPFFSTLKFLNNEISTFFVCRLESAPPPYTLLRYGVSCISRRYDKVNKKYLKSYYPKQELKHITYLDRSNLYGYVMPKVLRTSGFK